MDRQSSRKVLRAIRRERKLSVRKSALQVGVSHVAWLDWEKGAKVPQRPYRDLLAAWAGQDDEGNDRLPASAWPMSRAERQIAARAATLRGAA